MGKLIVFNNVSVDGFFAGPNGEIQWFHRDPAAMDFAREAASPGGTLVFGRVTYELMASYWPTAVDDDPALTRSMNESPKVVFSRTLKSADWKNTTIVRRIDQDEVMDMKRRSDRGVAVLGSGSIVSALTRLGLVDEYQLMVNPVVFGAGKSLFAGLEHPLELRRVDARPVGGNVLLRYVPS